MYCRKCGAQIEDTSSYCPYCGEATYVNHPQQNPTNNNDVYADYLNNNYNNNSNNNNAVANSNNQSKTAVGVLMSLFLGLLGLFIGVMMYPQNTVARKTFVKGWVTAFCVSLGLTVLMYIVAIAAVY